MPEPPEWWGDTEAATALVEAQGPWPVARPQSNGAFVPLDVDRYGNLAIVVGLGSNAFGAEAVGFATFERGMRDRSWRRYGGGSGGGTLSERWEVNDDDGALLRLQMHMGWGAQRMDAVFICGPEVATVEVERRHGSRIADVREGPGWLGIVWPNDDPPRVGAFDAGGRQTFLLTPPNRAD